MHEREWLTTSLRCSCVRPCAAEAELSLNDGTRKFKVQWAAVKVASELSRLAGCSQGLVARRQGCLLGPITCCELTVTIAGRQSKRQGKHRETGIHTPVSRQNTWTEQSLGGFLSRNKLLAKVLDGSKSWQSLGKNQNELLDKPNLLRCSETDGNTQKTSYNYSKVVRTVCTLV